MIFLIMIFFSSKLEKFSRNNVVKLEYKSFYYLKQYKLLFEKTLSVHVRTITKIFYII